MLLAIPSYWFLVLGAMNPPDGIVVLAEERTYQAAREPEQSWEGTLERNSSTGKLGESGFCPFRLTGKGFAMDLHVPARPQVIAVRVGQNVRITGKKIDGRLWPGRLEVLAEPVVKQPPPRPALPEGVRAQCAWQPDSALQRGARQYVFRDGKSLAQALRLQGASAGETATRQLAQKLGVTEIDWNKQMLVTIAAGLRGAEAERLVVTRAVVVDRILTVSYRL